MLGDRIKIFLTKYLVNNFFVRITISTFYLIFTRNVYIMTKWLKTNIRMSRTVW